MAGSTQGQRVQPVDPSTFTQCMEQLQEGYVAAVAATAGCVIEPKRRDVYGIDIEIVRPRGSTVQEQMIFAQLKNTTTIKPDVSKEEFSYQFKAREHLEHLTKPRTNPKAILLVMVTHPDQSLWTAGDHEELTLVHCCYWANLEGHAIKDGVKHPSVRVKTANRFDAASLISMFDRLDKGQAL